MNVGLPGTGLGGIFYFLSIVFMLVLEAVRFFRGRSDADGGKRRVALQSGMLLFGVIGTMTLLDWYGDKLFASTGTLPGHTGPSGAVITVLALSPILVSFGTLLCLFMAVTILRFFVKPKKQN